jgi:MFS family permease
VFLFGMIALTASFAHFANHHWAALHLHAELGATAEVAGFGYACYRGATAAGQFLGPWLIGRFGETGVLVCGFFLAALSSLATSWAAHLPGGLAVAFAGYLLLGIGLANAVPITVAWGGRYGGSRGVSRTQAVSGVGVIVQAPLIGMLADPLGLPTALSSVAVLSVTGAAIAIVLRRYGHTPSLG